MQTMRMRSISSRISHGREIAAKQQGMKALPIGNPQLAIKHCQVCSPGLKADITSQWRGGGSLPVGHSSDARFEKRTGKTEGEAATRQHPLTGIRECEHKLPQLRNCTARRPQSQTNNLLLPDHGPGIRAGAQSNLKSGGSTADEGTRRGPSSSGGGQRGLRGSASSRGSCGAMFCGSVGAKGDARRPVVGLAIHGPAANRDGSAKRHRGFQVRATGAQSLWKDDTKLLPGLHLGRRGRACARARWGGGDVGYFKDAGQKNSWGFWGHRAVQGAAQGDPRGRCTLTLSQT